VGLRTSKSNPDPASRNVHLSSVRQRLDAVGTARDRVSGQGFRLVPCQSVPDRYGKPGVRFLLSTAALSRRAFRPQWVQIH